MTPTLDKKALLGRTAEGYRVVVDVHFGPDGHGNAERQPTVESVTHETIPHPNVLTICGEVVDPRRHRRNWDVASGQVVDSVREITRPAGTLTVADLARFADLWEAWHLNTLRAACAHMDTTIPEGATVPYHYGQPDEQGWRIANLVCPVTGYTYGHAWLAEVVPDEIVEELAAILAEGVVS